MDTKNITHNEYYRELLGFCQDSNIARLTKLYDIPIDIINWLRPYIVKAYKKDQKNKNTNYAISILYALCTKTEYGADINFIIRNLVIRRWSPNNIFDRIKVIKYIKNTNNIRTSRVLNKFIIMIDDIHVLKITPCPEKYGYISLLDFYQTLFWNSPVCCDFLIEGYSNTVQQAGIKKNELELQSRMKYTTSWVEKHYFDCIHSYTKERCQEYGNLRIHNIYPRIERTPADLSVSEIENYKKWYNVYFEGKIPTENQVRNMLEELVLTYVEAMMEIVDGEMVDGFTTLYNFYIKGGIKIFNPKEIPKLVRNTSYVKIQEYYKNDKKLRDQFLKIFHKRAIQFLFSKFLDFHKKFDTWTWPYGPFAYVNSGLVDLYTCGRLLRLIKNSNSGIIVIQAGNIHTNLYYDFIKEVFPDVLWNRTNYHNNNFFSDCTSLDENFKKDIINNLQEIFRKPNSCSYKKLKYPE